MSAIWRVFWAAVFSDLATGLGVLPLVALKSADRKAFIPPLHGALLKNEQDVHLFERLAFLHRRERG